MKVLFIQQDVFKAYGLMLLSSILKNAGHKVEILIDSLEKNLFGKIKKINPDVIAFSLVSTRWDWMSDLAKRIKLKFNKPILVGGPHPTFFPEIIQKEFIDIVCIGEGEEATLELFNNLERGKSIRKIKNLWVKEKSEIHKNPVRNLIENLDAIPYADRALYQKYPLLRIQNMDVFMAGRGCPYNCTFCFNKKYNELYHGKGKILRRRSVSNLIDEMKQAKVRNRKIDYIQFHDDDFVLCSASWLDEFIREYRQKIGIPFSVSMRANDVNEEIIKKLKYAGCNSIRMGIESANPHIREQIMKKGITNKQILKASKIIQKHKINLQVYSILGAPGETLETAFETYNFFYNIHPTHAWCSLMQPYPGTEIMEIAKQQNLIKKDYTFENLDNSYFSTLPLNLPHNSEICNLQKLFQFGNVLRIPPSIIKSLVKFPPNPIYDLIFKINFALGTKKIDNLSWSYVFGVALHSRHFFARKHKES